VYESYFSLTERPFDLSPNPRFLFLSRRHSEALTHLRYGLTGRPGLTVLIGEAGTGKTTLVRAALQLAASESPTPCAVVHLTNPTMTRNEFYEYLATGFGFSAAAGQSKSRFLNELEVILERPSGARPAVALIADEAQSLPHELLEEVRLLTNAQSKSGHSLTVVLVGQPELTGRLNEDRLRQLKQRVALRCDLVPLDLQETASYIATRIRVAGGKPEQIFTRDAISTTHEYSRGIPRTISVICDSAMVNGFATDFKPIGRDIILEVCRDFELTPAPSAAAHTVKPSQPSQPNRPSQPSRPQPARVEPAGVEPASVAVASSQPAAPTKQQKPLFSTFQRRKRFFIF
jgi:general secretion pathway protein A